MGRKVTTGESSAYSDRDEGILAAALDRAFQSFDGGEPTRVDSFGEVEWGGTFNASPVRPFRPDGLNLRPVREAVERARQASSKAQEARPARSYQAKGWHAQLRALVESSRGSAAADKAGLSPSARTLERWLSTDQTPNKANQERISAAYGELRDWRVNEARQAASEAEKAVVKAFTDALADRYGSDIRIRDIEWLELLP